MTRKLIGILFCSALLGASSARASLIGTSVTGDLSFATNTTNYYDPTNGFVPATGFENTSSTTVTIAQPAVEFGFDDAANEDSANFTSSQLFIEDQVINTPSDDNSTETFTDPAFAGLTITPSITDFYGPVTASLSGDTITVTTPGGSVTPETSYVAVFNITTATPEPATLGVLAVAGVGLLARRRVH